MTCLFSLPQPRIVVVVVVFVCLCSNNPDVKHMSDVGQTARRKTRFNSTGKWVYVLIFATLLLEWCSAMYRISSHQWQRWMQMTTMTSRLINWADLLFDFFLSVFSNIPSKRSREESVVITIAPLRSGFQYRNLQTSLMQPNKQTNETGQTPTKKNEKDQSDGRSLFQRLPTTFSIFFILLCFFFESLYAFQTNIYICSINRFKDDFSRYWYIMLPIHISTSFGYFLCFYYLSKAYVLRKIATCMVFFC